MRKYFGTDGIRRIANTELTPDLLYKVAKAGAYVLAKHSDKAPIILIGRDTRNSGTLIESAMTAGFLSYGANVKLLGVMPTPVVAYLTKKFNANSSVVISASHNTFDFNGIKFFSNKGMKIPDEIEEEIEEILESDKLDKLYAAPDKIGVSEDAEYYIEDYKNFIKKIFGNTFKKLPEDFFVVLDTANGATYKLADEVYTMLGISHLTINNKPDGININEKCGSTHIDKVADFVKQHKFSLGIAYDGDGDRCLAVDDNGEVMDGDCIMAILGMNMKREGKLQKDTLVATVMSNLGMTKFTEQNNINLRRTDVGDRYVLEDMLANGYNLGGEQSGHVILLDYNPTGDGILTSLMLIKALIDSKQKASEIRKIIKVYPQVLINAKVSSDKKYDFNKDEEINKRIEKLEEEFSGNGRVLIRASGTEPKVRVMIEGDDQEYITKKAQELANFIEKRLN